MIWCVFIVFVSWLCLWTIMFCQYIIFNVLFFQRPFCKAFEKSQKKKQGVSKSFLTSTLNCPGWCSSGKAAVAGGLCLCWLAGRVAIVHLPFSCQIWRTCTFFFAKVGGPRYWILENWSKFWRRCLRFRLNGHRWWYIRIQVEWWNGFILVNVIEYDFLLFLGKTSIVQICTKQYPHLTHRPN